jgi:hypothetical protein
MQTYQTFEILDLLNVLDSGDFAKLRNVTKAYVQQPFGPGAATSNRMQETVAACVRQLQISGVLGPDVSIQVCLPVPVLPDDLKG